MPAIRKITYKDHVVDHVYQALLDGRCHPGDQLKEGLLATELGISRAPVREALKELTARGIVDYRPQVGCFITRPSPQEISDAYTVRGLLEGYAVMANHEAFSEADLLRLEALVEEMRQSAGWGDRKAVVEVGDTFHNLLVSRNANAQLAEYLERLRLKTHIFFCRYWPEMYSPAEIGDRHLQIVDSLRSGDPRAIEETVRLHYRESGERIATLALAGGERHAA